MSIFSIRSCVVIQEPVLCLLHMLKARVQVYSPYRIFESQKLQGKVLGHRASMEKDKLQAQIQRRT